MNRFQKEKEKVLEYDRLLIQHSFALFEMSSYCSLGSHHFLNKPAFASEALLLACQRQAKHCAHIASRLILLGH